MVLTPSTMRLSLGIPAPAFSLPDPSGKVHSLADFSGKRALLVAFLCNHCPYVKHIAPAFSQLAKDYQPHGVAVVGINSNDFGHYPDDSPAKMSDEVKLRDYTFPYLLDETQAVAKAYGAACTPDFYLFDADHKLVYRGQMDDSRPGSSTPVTGRDIRAALDALLSGRAVTLQQQPSIGCNIKWKPGNAPAYFG